MDHLLNGVLIRPITEEDLNNVRAFLQFINEIICDSSIKTSFSIKRTIKEEIDWLKRVIVLYKQKKMLQMVALKDERVLGMCDITLLGERKSHIGDFGIALAKDVRGRMFGQELAGVTIKKGAVFFGDRLKILRVCFPISKNKAKRFYELLGFRVVAVVPDQYLFDMLEAEIIMTRKTTKEDRS